MKIVFSFFLSILLIFLPANSGLWASEMDEHEVTIVVPRVLEMEFTSFEKVQDAIAEHLKKQQKITSRAKYSLMHNNHPVKMIMGGSGKGKTKGFYLRASTEKLEGSGSTPQGLLMILDGVGQFAPAQDALTNIDRGVYESGNVDLQMWSEQEVKEPESTVTITFTIVNN